MLKKPSPSDTKTLASLHYAELSGDFLPSFGEPFLELLHQLILSSNHATALGFYEKNELVGFVVGTNHTGNFFSDIFKRGLPRMLPYVLRKLVLQPTTVKHFWQTLFYGNKKSDISAELIIIVVKDTAQGKGIGTQLLEQLKKEFKNKDIKTFLVSTTAENRQSNAFYSKRGGKALKKFHLYDKNWQMYVFDTK